MDRWFEEQLEVSLGRAIKIKARLLESVKSDFQQIDVYRTECFGKMLVHDEVIMLTEFDEANYHEMITHVALMTHPAPERVLVIGGGDGGTLREILKHNRVRQADLCEIDSKVIDVCRRHFPSLSVSFEDPRANVFFEDGAEFVKQRPNTYDVIIVDSSDPVGPAEVLFQKEFYQNMKRALKPGGMVITQSESFHYHRDLILNMADFINRMFPVYHYFYTLVPTYPSGLIGFSFCSLEKDPGKIVPDTGILAELGPLKYYNPDIHRASFALPQGFRKQLKQFE